MSERRDRIISWAALSVLAAFLAVFALINFRRMTVFCDGDVYADMLLAREMWRQKTLFPADWIFGNQYYVIATPVAAALFYGLTGSMNLSMALATTLMGLLLLLSFAWLLRPLVAKRSHRLCALLLLVAAPMGTELLLEPEGQLFFVLASYYACYLITLFVVFGDYLRALERPDAVRPLPLSLALLLSFACGMQSLRQTAVMVLPLLALELLALLRRLVRREGILPPARRRAARRCLAAAAANLLGCVCIRALHVPSRSIYDRVSASSGGLWKLVHDLWTAWRGISGLDAAAFGKAPVFFWLFFALQLACVLAAAVSVLRKLRSGPDGLGVLWLLCAVSLGGTLLAGLLVQLQMREIYLFLWYPFTAISCAVVLEALPAPVPRRLLAALLCLLCLGNLYFSYGSSLRWARERDTAPFTDLCRRAEEAGIEYAYGEWSIVPLFAVWSDGALTGGFWGEIYFDVRESINLQNIYSEEDNEKAVYLLGPWNRGYVEDYAAAHGAELEVFADYGDYIAYRSSRQLMTFAYREGRLP